jgi:hypothetical protein
MHIALLNLGFIQRADKSYVHGELGFVVEIRNKEIVIEIEGKSTTATLEQLEEMIIEGDCYA